MNERTRYPRNRRARKRLGLQRLSLIALLLAGQMAVLSHVEYHELGREDCAVCRTAAKSKQVAVGAVSLAIAAPTAMGARPASPEKRALRSARFDIPQTRAPPGDA